MEIKISIASAEELRKYIESALRSFAEWAQNSGIFPVRLRGRRSLSESRPGKNAGNNVVLFVNAKCVLGKDMNTGKQYRASPPEVFKRYIKWCKESNFEPCGKLRFYDQLYLHFKVRRVRPTNETREMFGGIGLLDDSPNP